MKTALLVATAASASTVPLQWRSASVGPAAAAASSRASVLKHELRLTAARANRGFTPGVGVAARLAAVVDELETLNECDEPTGSPDLLGRWYLDYTDAVDVLSLALQPFAEVGDIVQEVEAGAEAGQFSAQNECTLLPRGAAILPAGLGPKLASTYSVEAACRVLSPTKLSLAFVGFNAGPLAGLKGQLPLALPRLGARLPAAAVDALEKGFAERVYLETTYLDPGLRIARGPSRELYVLSKRAAPGEAVPGQAAGEAAGGAAGAADAPGPELLRKARAAADDTIVDEDACDGVTDECGLPSD